MPKKQTLRGTDSAATIAAREGKLPPQDIDAEEAVLGAIMLDQDAFSEISDILKPEHFYKDVHQDIFTAIQSLGAKMKAIDMITVAEELKSMTKLETIGGRSYLAQLTERVASAVNIEHHARIIFQKYLQRELIRLGNSLVSDGFSDDKDVDLMLSDAEQGLFELTSGSMKREPQPLAPILDNVLKKVYEASQRDDMISGLPSGFASIDRVTSGWQKATMVVIAARPGMGKTAFILSMMRNMALAPEPIPVAMFSLEMAAEELGMRLIVQQSHIIGDKVKNGHLTQSELEQLQDAAKTLSNAPIYIDDTPGLSIIDIRSKSMILKRKHNIKAIFIDYLQLMTAGGGRFGNRQEEVAVISRNIKALSKELDLPVFALSQVTRDSEKRVLSGPSVDGRMPQLSDLRESGAIEQDADIVCFIHRPEKFGIKEDSQGNSLVGVAYFNIAKHRSGRTENILLHFEENLAQFEETNLQPSYFSDSDDPLTSQTFASSMNNAVPTELVTPNLNGNLPDFSTNTGEVPF